ncbi:hypothetical protein Tco_0001895 [Tanacetum coccineum]
MLSEKKMKVGVTTIQFLGMEIYDEKYQLQPHVAQELLKFPDELSSPKMIQQFLGLVNYMADFLPKLSHHTALLFPILEKNPPQWTSRQTEAEEGSSSTPTPPIPVFDLPEERVETIGDLNFEKRAKLCYKTFLTILLKNNGLCIKGLRRFPKEALCFFYHLFERFTIGITFNAEKLLSYVVKSQFKDAPPL